MADNIPPSIAELQQRYDAGLSPVRVIEDCLERIASSNDRINAMIFVGGEEALEQAYALEAELRSGRSRGPLHGIPVAVKDVIDVKGWPTTSGSRLFGDHVAADDAICIQNLRAAGGVIVGKTNLHQLTAGGHDNPWFGKVVNPLNPTHGTGGTSSGSAAAVAAGFCLAALGTDTGGSNGSTAAATGLVGFKPTNGCVDTRGVRPTAPSLDVIGPIASSIEDARLVHFAALGGATPGAETIPLAGLRIGLCSDLYASRVDPVVAGAHERLLRALTAAGARSTPLAFPLAGAVKDAGLTILQYEFAACYADRIEAAPDAVGSAARDFAAGGRAISSAAYERALMLRRQARVEFLELMSSVDLVLAPVAPGLAPRLSDEMSAVGDTWTPYGPAGGSFRRWANFFGLPALAMPLPTPGDLPASIQISTLPDTDALLFSLAEAVFRAEEAR
ncbi:amidase [Rhizobium sp. TRM95796]|uniref:amidase n=1 Tax=Rhizobium sp. TRM95796 TaxID=2979862 RepID=UPI0021E92084|nr:amidase [Rhizobium sp. TRM95796]MCV3768904.1 amidase [Rhizobium sp. TRM95796]